MRALGKEATLRPLRSAKMKNPSILYMSNKRVARLSKPKSTTHDFAQAIMKKLFKQKINYPI